MIPRKSKHVRGLTDSSGDVYEAYCHRLFGSYLSFSMRSRRFGSRQVLPVMFYHPDLLQSVSHSTWVVSGFRTVIFDVKEMFLCTL